MAKKITLSLPVQGKDVHATVTNDEISFKEAKAQYTTWGPKLPQYASNNIDDDSLSKIQFEVDNNQDALKVNDINFQLHPLASDISAQLIESMIVTGIKKFNAEKIYIRLDKDKPTEYIFGKSKPNTSSTAPLESIPKAPTSAHHHNEPTPSTTPTAKPKMPANNENLIRRYYQQMIARITAEYEDKIKKLKDKLLKQRHSYETKLKEQKKHYELQLQQKQQPKLALPKSNQRIVDWVQHNWKVLEPTFKQYALAMYSSQNERQNGGEDGKGDKFEADKYKKQAQDIMTMSLNEFFKHVKQATKVSQPKKDMNKKNNEERELGE